MDQASEGVWPSASYVVKSTVVTHEERFAEKALDDRSRPRRELAHQQVSVVLVPKFPPVGASPGLSIGSTLPPVTPTTGALSPDSRGSYIIVGPIEGVDFGVSIASSHWAPIPFRYAASSASSYSPGAELTESARSATSPSRRTTLASSDPIIADVSGLALSLSQLEASSDTRTAVHIIGQGSEIGSRSASDAHSDLGVIDSWSTPAAQQAAPFPGASTSHSASLTSSRGHTSATTSAHGSTLTSEASAGVSESLTALSMYGAELWGPWVEVSIVPRDSALVTTPDLQPVPTKFSVNATVQTMGQDLTLEDESAAESGGGEGPRADMESGTRGDKTPPQPQGPPGRADSPTTPPPPRLVEHWKPYKAEGLLGENAFGDEDSWGGVACTFVRSQVDTWSVSTGGRRSSLIVYPELELKSPNINVEEPIMACAEVSAPVVDAVHTSVVIVTPSPNAAETPMPVCPEFKSINPDQTIEIRAVFQDDAALSIRLLEVYRDLL